MCEGVWRISVDRNFHFCLRVSSDTVVVVSPTQNGARSSLLTEDRRAGLNSNGGTGGFTQIIRGFTALNPLLSKLQSVAQAVVSEK